MKTEHDGRKQRNASVDADNLTKAILDCLNNVIYKDDSQIYSVLTRKYCNQGRESISIGIRKLRSANDSIFDGITIFTANHLAEED